jgi:O-antigen ligase
MSLFADRRQDAWLGLFNFIPFFSLFATFSLLLQTPAQLRRLAQILVLTSVPIVIMGFGQLYWGWSTPKAWHAIFLALGCAIAPQGNPPGRMTSIFMYTNVLAAYLAIAFILSLGLWIESLWEKSKVKSQKSKLLHSSPLVTRILLGAAVMGNLAALILTNSRNAWAIAAIAAIAFAVYRGWQWLLLGVSAIAAAIFGAAFAPPPLQSWLRLVIPAYFWQRLTDQLYVRPEATLRTTQWQFAWNLTVQRPLTGWGLRNFQPLYFAQTQTWMGHPHNLFLMLTAEIGIPATIIYCAWIAWILFQALQLLAQKSPDFRFPATGVRLLAPTDCAANVGQPASRLRGSDGEGTSPSARFPTTRFRWRGNLALHPLPDSQLPHKSDRLIFFTYLVAVCASLLFNTVDVTIFDARLNTLFWILLAAIAGVIERQRTIAFVKMD